MIAIGSCDICGEFCASDIDDDFATAEYHNRLAERLHDCDERHVGPWHGSRGEPLKKCAWCAELADYRGEDNTLDHSECRRCNAERPMRGRRAPAGWRRRTPLQLEPRFYVPSSRAMWMSAPQQAIDRQLRRDLACTEPADRRRAERALSVYFGRPARVRWYDSPRELGAAFSEAAHKAGLHLPPEEEGEEELDEPFSFWNMAPAALRERVAWGSDERLSGVADTVVREFEHRAFLIGSTVADLATPADDEIRLPTTDAGQLDLNGRRADVTEAAHGEAVPDGGFLQLLAELRASTGPALIFDGVVHILERPLALRLDDHMRLHSEEGPALAYSDGSEAWAIHGVVVPRQVVAAPDQLTVEQIDAQPNQEVRRVMIERFGAERLMREANAELLSSDGAGKLWRWQPGQGRWWGRRTEPVVMVEVVNSTPESDGTFRTYFLRVPPNTSSAREAVAWTFDLDRASYDPVAET